jgi:hypothetical protein
MHEMDHGDCPVDSNANVTRTRQGVQGGGWRLEAGGWRLEAGGWRLEAGGWRLEAGGFQSVPPRNLPLSNLGNALS